MGLDIYHSRATLQKPENLNPDNQLLVLEDDFKGFDVNFEYFRNCIAQIDVAATLQMLIFPGQEQVIDKVKMSATGERA